MVERDPVDDPAERHEGLRPAPERLGNAARKDLLPARPAVHVVDAGVDVDLVVEAHRPHVSTAGNRSGDLDVVVPGRGTTPPEHPAVRQGRAKQRDLHGHDVEYVAVDGPAADADRRGESPRPGVPRSEGLGVAHPGSQVATERPDEHDGPSVGGEPRARHGAGVVEKEGAEGTLHVVESTRPELTVDGLRERASLRGSEASREHLTFREVADHLRPRQLCGDGLPFPRGGDPRTHRVRDRAAREAPKPCLGAVEVARGERLRRGTERHPLGGLISLALHLLSEAEQRATVGAAANRASVILQRRQRRVDVAPGERGLGLRHGEHGRDALGHIGELDEPSQLDAVH